MGDVSNSSTFESSSTKAYKLLNQITNLKGTWYLKKRFDIRILFKHDYSVVSLYFYVLEDAKRLADMEKYKIGLLEMRDVVYNKTLKTLDYNRLRQVFRVDIFSSKSPGLTLYLFIFYLKALCDTSQPLLLPIN